MSANPKPASAETSARFSTSLFRKVAIDHHGGNAYGRVINGNLASHRAVTIFSLLIAASIILYFSVASISRKVQLSGIILPRGGLVRLLAPQTARVIERRVSEGQSVKKGDILFVLSASQGLQGGADAEDAISGLLQKRRSSYNLDLTQFARQSEQRNSSLQEKLVHLREDDVRIDNQIARQQQRVQLADEAYSRFKELQATHYISTAQLQEKFSDLLDQRQRLDELARTKGGIVREISAAQADLSDLRIQATRDSAAIARNVSTAEQEFLQNETRREIVIRAPQNGVVTAITAEAGQVLPAAQPAATLLPANAELEAEIYAPSHAIGFIREGMEVNLRYQAYPYQKFGQKTGRVREIASAALGSDEFNLVNVTGGDKAVPVYRVRIQLQQQTVRLDEQTYPLKSGMLVDASVSAEKRRLIEWVVGPLASFSGRQ